jgi:hypothetical protein
VLAGTEWPLWLEHRLASAFPRHHVGLKHLVAVLSLPPFILLALGGVDLVWRGLVWVAWLAVSSSLVIVALLDWARSVPDSRRGPTAVRSTTRAFLALFGIAGASVGVWILVRAGSDLVAARASFGTLGLGGLLGASAVCSGVQMATLPFKRGTQAQRV